MIGVGIIIIGVVILSVSFVYENNNTTSKSDTVTEQVTNASANSIGKHYSINLKESVGVSTAP